MLAGHGFQKKTLGNGKYDMGQIYTLPEHCPECGGNEIQVIDRILNEKTREYENRSICWSCGHDWHEAEENKGG